MKTLKGSLIDVARNTILEHWTTAEPAWLKDALKNMKLIERTSALAGDFPQDIYVLKTGCEIKEPGYLCSHIKSTITIKVTLEDEEIRK